MCSKNWGRSQTPLYMQVVAQYPTISQLRVLTRLLKFAHTVNAATLSPLASSLPVALLVRNRRAKPKSRES